MKESSGRGRGMRKNKTMALCGLPTMDNTHLSSHLCKPIYRLWNNKLHIIKTEKELNCNSFFLFALGIFPKPK